MAKKMFAAGVTKSNNLNNNGGEKIKELEAKKEYNFKYIPKEKIISNPKNEMYAQDGIEALTESIIENGLRHNLSVIFDADNDNYRLISGERRFHAICAMTDKQYNSLFPLGIPCKVEKSDITEIDEEIMLISANHDVREASMEVKRWEVSRLNELYSAKKLKGEIKNINAEIAKQLGITERQARKYTTAEKLIPELSDLLNANGIDLNQADKFGKLDEEAQKSILNILKKNGSIETSEYQAIKKQSEEKAKEAKKYKEDLDTANAKLEKQNETLRLLEDKIKSIEASAKEKNIANISEDSNNENYNNSKSKEALEDELKYIKEAKAKAEKEKNKLENDLEKIKLMQKEKEKRNTTISDAELKRITSIAKTEQALDLFEKNFDVLKNNKALIKNDSDLRIRIEILKSRLDDLISNL